MSDVYIYNAAFLCEACGEALMSQLDKEGKKPANVKDESSFDSDQYPKGPFDDGGGESDSPNHCDACREFLENPLTDDGYEYIRQLLLEHQSSGRGDAKVLLEWAKYYDIQIPCKNQECKHYHDGEVCDDCSCTIYQGIIAENGD